MATAPRDDSYRSARSTTIREASFQDYSQIAALESAYGLEVKANDEWQHLWLRNPAYQEHRNELPIGWVLEDENKHITGYLGNIPLPYEFEGRRLLASAAHSWVVNSQCRSYAPLLLQRYFSQKIIDLYLNSTVGPAAAESFAAFESLRVPAGTWDRSAFSITNYSGFLSGWLAMKGVALSRPLGEMLSLGPRLQQALFKRRRDHDLTGSELQCCTHIDERFDDFWKALRKNNPNVLLGVRSREALEWHFGHALRNGRAWILVATKGQAITACSTFRRYDNPAVSLKRMRLVDFKALDGSTDALPSMWSWALNRCRDEGIHMLESVGLPREKHAAISNLAPYERKLPSWLYFYQASGRDLAQKLSTPKAWDPSQFDGDAAL
jgi:hypothetical protein